MLFFNKFHRIQRRFPFWEQRKYWKTIWYQQDYQRRSLLWHPNKINNQMSIRKKNRVRHKAFYLTLSYCIFISKSNLVLECQNSFCWWNSSVLFFNYISSCSTFLVKWQMGILTHGCFNFDANKVNKKWNDKHKSALMNRIYSISWRVKWSKIHQIHHFRLSWLKQIIVFSLEYYVLKIKLYQVYNLNYHCCLI